MALSFRKLIKGIFALNETDHTKEVGIIIDDSATTNTSTVIYAKQTANRSLDLPDVSGVLVEKDANQILTSKTIDADLNTITNIKNADIKVAAAIDAAKIHDGSVSNTEFGYLSTVTSDIQTQLNTNASAISDHLSDTSDAHDASSISNIPSGNLVATDIQNAVNELQSDIDSRALDSAVIKKDGSVAFTADQSIGGFKLTNVADPTALQDVATKNYVDANVGTGANTSLSNLTNPTSINQNLIPNTSNTKTIGSISSLFSNLYSYQITSYQQITLTDGTVTPQMILSLGSTPVSAISSVLLRNSSTTRDLGLVTDSVAGSTRGIIAETGEAFAGTSGSITLRTGPASGTRGTIRFIDGSLASASVGYVWTLQNTSTGSGNWVASPSSLTGVMQDYLGTTAPTGYIFASGNTIGSGASGATERANSDTETLYTLLWNSYSNAILPIQDSTGVATTRGVSAAADFAANKRLPTPDLRGRIAAGRDDMGGSAANRLTSAGAGINGAVLGSSGGAETHVLSILQMPSHQHDRTFRYGTRSGGGSTALVLDTDPAFSGTVNYSTNNSGSGQAHQNTQPTWVVNKIIKL